MAKIGEYADHIDEITDSPDGEVDENELDTHLQQGLMLVQKLKLDIEDLKYLPSHATTNMSKQKSYNATPREKRRTSMNEEGVETYLA
jgi:hypothetical protein